MLEAVSDFFHLVNALQSAKVNWNNFRWRLHVKADVAAFDLEVGEHVQQILLIF